MAGGNRLTHGVPALRVLWHTPGTPARRGLPRLQRKEHKVGQPLEGFRAGRESGCPGARDAGSTTPTPQELLHMSLLHGEGTTASTLPVNVHSFPGDLQAPA